MTFTISKESLPLELTNQLVRLHYQMNDSPSLSMIMEQESINSSLLTKMEHLKIFFIQNNSETYANDGGYYGVICGPVAGRISGATYDSVSLEANEGKIIYIQEAMAGKDNFGLMKLLKQHHLLALN